MTSGEIVNDVRAIVVGTPQDFQPAGTNEFIILQISCSALDGISYLYDGTTSAAFTKDGPTQTYTKLCINNTNYLRQISHAGTINMGYSGMQTR